MIVTKPIVNQLRRLCALEFETASELARSLTDREKQHEIERLRCIIPLSILSHHDRMLQRGKPSIVPASGEVCSACHVRVPKGKVNRMRANELELCDNCGAFLYWEKQPSGAPPKFAPVRRRALLRPE